MRIAIVGSGISGLSVAHTLQGRADITLFEAGDYFGGHTHTVDVTLPGAHGPVTHGVDTGFLVYNERTYPNLVRLFAELGVETTQADMSFSVQAAQHDLEWSGSDLGSVFAQRRNLVRPRFWRMLSDIHRFNQLATQLALQGKDAALAQPIGDFLQVHGFSKPFRDWYLLPMISCIWSCPPQQMLAFPVATLIRFCHNHGLLQITQRPQWLSVRGGSREYVRRIVAGLRDARLNTPVLAIQRMGGGVMVRTAQGTEFFDQVVLACHSDQALQLLGNDATALERQVLGAVGYQPNRAVLHTDASLLPRRQTAWAAWNFESAAKPDAPQSDNPGNVCLHYLINRLQALPWKQPVIVSLNPVREPDPRQVLQSFEYAHPVFDQAAIEAQRQLPLLQGQRQTWFCGAWTGYGFHEDGLKSGMTVAQDLAQVRHDTWQGVA
jgi:predicted NAD/FAD-binding protein